MIETIYSDHNFLEHHGVPGMKWGVRKKSRNKNVSSNSKKGGAGGSFREKSKIVRNSESLSPSVAPLLKEKGINSFNNTVLQKIKNVPVSELSIDNPEMLSPSLAPLLKSKGYIKSK